jgi:hypothetical protein
MTTKTGLMVAVALALGAGLGGAAQATPLALPSQLPAVDGGTVPIERVQFVYSGRNYCFYPDGWHGPGWYWCGYASRRGLGWGGVEGWRGWHRGGRHEDRRRHNDHHDGGRHHH